MKKFPTGTFLFTDIEGSTKLSQEYPDGMPALLSRHNEILHQAIKKFDGFVFNIVGDSFSVAFHKAGDAISTVLEAQRALQTEQWSPVPIKVRMGIHSGTSQPTADGTNYAGYSTLALAQRVMSAGHGGQVLISQATYDLLDNNLPLKVQLIDMGEHYLKDVIKKQHLYQLQVEDLSSEFPPIKAQKVINHNLPVKLTSFIGREQQLQEIRSKLEETRLLTLTGSGGTGKTRLSIQVGEELLPQFADGVWMIELAPISDAALIHQTVASVFGLRESPELPLIELVSDYLRAKSLLIILDNCEHMVEACAELVELLIHSCTNLILLVSSREALGVPGETIYRVPSLLLPDQTRITRTEVMKCESAQLFVDRAKATNPDFQVTDRNVSAIAQICRRLDGIPLALELAAARTKVLSVEQISERLDDRFRLLTSGARTALTRQQTLRALIDWSYNLLSEKEKTLFRRLAVFGSGWTLEAAEAVCSDETADVFEVLDVLSSLVDKSLITMDETEGYVRYHRLETIRQYSREKFFDMENVKAIRDRHLAWMESWAQKIEPEMEGENQIDKLKQIKMELDNIRSAIEWGLGSNQVEQSMRIVSALSTYWDDRHPFQESREWLERGLASRMELSKRTLMRTLLVAAELAFDQYDMEVANRYALESSNVARELDNKQFLADALHLMTAVHRGIGNFSESEKYKEESRKIYEELKDKKQLIIFISDEILELMYQNDIPNAVKLAEEYAGTYEELNDSSRAWFYFVFGFLKTSQGDLNQGTILVRKSLLLSRQLNNIYYIANCLLVSAHLVNGLKKFAYAARLLGARHAVLQTVGAVDNSNVQRIVANVTAQTKSMLDEEVFQVAWHDGQAMTVDEAIEYALEETHE